MNDIALDTFTGPIFRPGDAGYDEEISGFQTAYAHRPALIAGAADAEDVRLAVEYAANNGLPVAVQATGHGLSVATGEDGVLIGTRRLDGVEIDPEARVGRIGAGVRAGALIEAAAAYGLAPLNGSSPSVGVVGYTLGGGVGILARQFGYAADHVRAIEIVTADARLRRLEPGDELFGAVLGTGGNFGVVTALELELVPVATVYGGQLIFDTPLIEEALEAWRRLTAGAPDELTSSVTMIGFPDLPQLPPPLRGRYVASFRIAYNGPAEEGERLVAPLRAVGDRIKDDLRSMPYSESETIHSDPADPHAYAATNALLGDLTPDTLHALLKAAGPDSPVPVVTDIRHLGGALRKRGPAQVAVDHRDAEYIVRIISGHGPGGDGPDEVRERFALIRQALAPWTVGQNLNFIYGYGQDADEAQTRGGYDPGTYERLSVLKAAYDPQNRFRFNRNIRPA
ncbi:FAD-binding oxidoreductase [Actinomadura barringtoniae]|uniref:FAD-binding oxidoreductase n=1 Tax=Actinomadura barringtoniae TaxID=1427535 RepID=A0A939TCJ6_9ACTN|nr:FAD-binding oxidoreductase [Actinomadura barringtoniae]MBO2454642.1 FAD-binding oxidoreductase [Actinomadura barringtoniae]